MSNLPANIADTISGINAMVQRHSAPVDTAGAQYMKLNKRGNWVYGVDDIEVEEGAVFALDIKSISDGYVSWNPAGGKPLGEEMARLGEPPVLPANLPDVGAPWSRMVALNMVQTNGEDKGTSMIYKASSKGACRAFDDTLRAIGTHLQSNPTETVPLIELGVDEYEHKSYGSIIVPVFKIVKWATADQSFDDVAEADEEVVEEEAPVRKRRRRA